MTETETEEWTDMDLEEDVSGDLQTQVEAVTSDKNANYLFVIKTEKTMKRTNLIKPKKISAKLINTIKEDPDDPIPRCQAREKSIKVLIDYYMSIDTEPKWTRQQWKNFIDTGDVDLSRPYSEYRLIGIEPSIQVNLPPNVPAPVVVADQDPINQDQVAQEDDQDGPEIQEEVQQPAPKPAVPKLKKAAPAPGFFGALVGGFANVFAEDSSGDDSPPALPMAGPSVPATKNVPYQKAGLTNLAAATTASFRNTGRQLDLDIVHRYPDDRKKTPSKKN